jgi:hypothetical protein
MKWVATAVWGIPDLIVRASARVSCDMLCPWV